MGAVENKQILEHVFAETANYADTALIEAALQPPSS